MDRTVNWLITESISSCVFSSELHGIHSAGVDLVRSIHMPICVVCCMSCSAGLPWMPGAASKPFHLLTYVCYHQHLQVDLFAPKSGAFRSLTSQVSILKAVNTSSAGTVNSAGPFHSPIAVSRAESGTWFSTACMLRCKRAEVC